VPGQYYKCPEEERAERLRLKLVEEVLEYLTEPSPEELADVLEVIIELLKLHGQEVINALIEKRSSKGGLEYCWILTVD